MKLNSNILPNIQSTFYSHILLLIFMLFSCKLNIAQSYFDKDQEFSTVQTVLKSNAITHSISDKGNYIKHLKIYHEPGRFGGWPANRGIWAWGNEILVGFSAAWYMNQDQGHAVDPNKPTQSLMARSLDGGESWQIEDPEKMKYFIPASDMILDTTISQIKYSSNNVLKEPMNFFHPNFTMELRMGDKHGTRPSYFHYSYNRGKNWHGPFILPNFNTPGIAARTDYIIDGEHELTVFLTAGKSDSTEGRTLCVKTLDGGLNWEFLSWIGPEPDGFRIMPSTVRLSPNEILTTVRIKESNRGLIEAWISKDNGKNWDFLSDVATDVGKDNPPSLVRLQDGRLAVTYTHRAEPYGIRARLSDDNGKTWSNPIILRDDGGSWDIGYTRSVQRPDGKIITIYYYWDKKTGPERYIAATIWDPNI